MSEDLKYIKTEIHDLKSRMTGLEEDVSQIASVQGRLFDCLKDIESSVVKLRESVMKLRNRMG